MRLRCALLFFAVSCAAQVYPPYGQPQGTGLPVPSWLRGTKTITGYVAGIDPDKILVRNLETGNILVRVDAQTKVHVEKTPMTLADLKDGDPVAVKVKEVKGVGPYAVEIMPHPDVLRRKQGHPTDAPQTATELPASPLPPAPIETAAPPGLSATPAAGMPAPRSASAPPLSVPALPRGQSGIQGKIVAMNGDEAKLETSNGETRTVLVTSVTRIVKAGTRDELMEQVRVGDLVAIMGDSVDSGVYIAREILVNRAKDAEVQQASAPLSGSPLPPLSGSPLPPPPSPLTSSPLKGDFTATVESVDNDVLTLKQPDGRSRKVIVTPITKIRKWNADTPLQGLRKGDELKIEGDVLDDGSTLAREITVTKPAPSR